MKRRTYLLGAATTVGISMPSIRKRSQSDDRRGGQSALQDWSGESGDGPEPEYMILNGTKYETGVYVIDAPESGPTGLVVGGIHGDERSGYHAAEAVSRWQFDAGRVVVLPRANQPAITSKTRHGVGGDLNRTFPPGEEPTTKLARAIWTDVVLRSDPDFLIDLHRSKGIYEFHQSFVGQAIYPSVVGDAQSYALDTIALLNEEYVPWYMPYHEFRQGNLIDGSRPMLTHKVSDDAGLPSYIVETTTFLTDLDARTRWTKGAAEKLLSLHGIDRTTEGP